MHVCGCVSQIVWVPEDNHAARVCVRVHLIVFMQMMKYLRLREKQEAESMTMLLL